MGFSVCVVSKCEHICVCECACVHVCVSSSTTFSLKEKFGLWGAVVYHCLLVMYQVWGSVRLLYLLPVPALWNVHFMLLLSSRGEWWHPQDGNMDAAVLGGRSRPGGTQPYPQFWWTRFLPSGVFPTPCPPSWHPPHILPQSMASYILLHPLLLPVARKLSSQDTSVIFVLQIFLILADTNHVPIATYNILTCPCSCIVVMFN